MNAVYVMIVDDMATRGFQRHEVDALLLSEWGHAPEADAPLHPADEAASVDGFMGGLSMADLEAGA